MSEYFSWANIELGRVFGEAIPNIYDGASVNNWRDHNCRDIKLIEIKRCHSANKISAVMFRGILITMHLFINNIV